MIRRLASAASRFGPGREGQSRRMPTRAIAVLAAGMVGVPLALVAGETASVSAASTSTFSATADAFVSAGNPGTNYGTRSVLKTDASPSVRSFLRFNVANLPASVTKATLQVYAKDANAAGFAVAGVANTTWGEDSVIAKRDIQAGEEITLDYDELDGTNFLGWNFPKA